MNKEIITKKDYEILEIKENSTPNEVGFAYEKLLQKYHPEKIKLEKLREPNELELKKYKEIEKVYKKFDFESEKYICCGRKEEETKKLVEAKNYLEKVKVQEIKNIKKYLERAKVKLEQLEKNNQNFEQEINGTTIKDADDSQFVKDISEITNRVEKDIQKGITNISLDPDSGKLVVEYGKNNSKVIEDNNLTSEQKEIKEFFQQTGKKSLSREQVKEEAGGKDKNSDNKWLGSVVGIGIAVLVIGFIGIVIYKNKKKGY
ncbi:10488_t:CDS:2 [Gigaspora margarita]|uniref:10488_t:CDS:1 n=1 Tax=Gigaspora margarita TaxID=4874 RepID=A0ABM8VWP2_GIGMA|nr:10488_t:CDS:2 [Gigaspora margarita]